MIAGPLVHDLLERAAHAHPERIAVVDASRALTYGELDARSNQIAHALSTLGVMRGDRVGLYLEKSVDAIVAVYGILKSGAAYVPHDPQAPAARLAHIQRNCGITVLATSTSKPETWTDLAAAGSPVTDLLDLSTDADATLELPPAIRHHSPAAIDAQSTLPLPRAQIDLDLAYILYTSGSTGVPKGVKLSHLNARTFSDWAAREFALTEEDRLASHAPLHFDLSVFDLFAAAAAGAAVVLVPPRTSFFPIEIHRFIAEQAITVWYSVPSILTLLSTRGGLHPGDLPTLRTVLFAGEVFPTKFLRQLMGLLPHVRFANLYGPTETNVCTWYDVPRPAPADDEPIPIGQAIDNVEVFALDPAGRRVETGSVGELYVRGSTVTHGYWADPTRTAEVLGPNPLEPELRDPVYRTGDLVRFDERGMIHYLGRRDNQIKSRGYRIELGEIETSLYAHPGVVECAVVAIPDDVFSNRIKAFVVARDGAQESELARFLGERLPRYMIPDLWEIRDELPRTSTGKVDRQLLVSSTSGD